MHRLPRIWASAALVSAFTSAAAVQADPVPAPRPAPPPQAKCRQIRPNGPELTGTNITVNAACGTNVQLRLARLNLGVTLDGKKLLPGVTLSEGSLVVAAAPAAPGPAKPGAGKPAPAAPTAPGTPAAVAVAPAGAQLAGAMLLGETEDGEQVRLRIDSVATADDPNPKTPVNENADTTQYRVSVQRGNGKKATSPLDSQFRPAAPGFVPLCKNGGAAIVLSGSWSMQSGNPGDARKEPAQSGEITFACLGSSLAKCAVVLGYKPWRSVTPATAAGSPAAKPVSLDGLHQACVRAVRADYCGNGLSMTAEGTQVNFYDSLGIQKDEASWPMEAVWSASGALCVNVPRLVTAPADPTSGRPAMKTRDYLAGRCPQLTKAAPCDKVSSPDGLTLFTEANPAAPAPSAAPPTATPPPAAPSPPATRN